MQWLQNPKKRHGANLKNITRETSRTFRSKKSEHLKEKFMSLEQKITEMLDSYQSRRRVTFWYDNKVSEVHAASLFISVNTSNLKNVTDLHRGVNYFKKVYQPITNLIKGENGNLLADSHNIFNRWRNYFCQLLIVRGVDDIARKCIQLRH
jgi:hypothetical protein